MIRQMNISLRNMRFYAADHPTTTTSLQRSYDALMKAVTEQGQLTLGVVGNTLIANESPIEESDRFVEQLTEELNVRNIESLVFYPDLTQDEFRVFLECLNREPDRLLAEGGVQQVFESEGIAHITANQVKYGKVSEASGEGVGSEESIIAAFLMGKMPTFGGDQDAFFALMEKNPGEIGEIINAQFAEMTKKGEGSDRAGRATHRAIEQIGRFLEAQPEGSVNRSAILAQIMASLNPEVQAGLHGYRVGQEDIPLDQIDGIVAEFRDEEVIRLMCHVYQGGLTSPGILARVAARALPDVGRRELIAPKLGPALIERGMPQEAWEILVDDLLWEVYDLGQRVERLTGRATLSQKDVGRIKEVGPDLAARKRGDELHTLVKILFATIKGQDAETEAAVAGYLPEFYNIVEDSGRFKGVGLFFSQKLIGLLGRETDETVRKSIVASLGVILKRQILADSLNAPARAVLTLSKMGILDELIQDSEVVVSQEVGDHLVTVLAGEDRARRHEALILLKVFGKAILESILFALEREENPDVRRALMSVLKSMGENVTGEITKRLADRRWYVVRSALYVLGEIGSNSISPNVLTSSAYHDDIRVRKEAIKTLGKLKGRGAVKILCELLQEKDEDIRLFVLRSLGVAGDKMAVPHILFLLHKKRLKGQKSDLLRQTAIETLGRIGDPEAIPVLLDFVKSKGLFKKTDEAIRKSAVEALGAFKEPELHEVLQSVLEKDTDLNVREAARRALLRSKSGEGKAASQVGM
jgi:HEAT repeat protein